MIALPRRRRCLAAFGALALLGLAAPLEAQVKARTSYHYSPTHPAAVNIEKFVERVHERVGGEVEIQTFPSGQLFGIRETLDAVASGAVQIGGVTGLVSFPPINRNYNVAGIFGMFDSYEEMRAFWKTDPVARRTWDAMLAQANVVVLAYNPVGPTFIASVKDVCTLEGMEGVAARVLVETDRPMWEAFKVGKMVSMPTGEVYTSLQSGLIDTVSTVPAGLSAFSWWEFIKYAQLPFGVFSDGYVVANRVWFETLPEAVRISMLEVGAEISAESTATIMAESNDILRRFAEEHGGTVCEMSEADQTRRATLEAEVMDPMFTEMVDADVLAAARAFGAK